MTLTMCLLIGIAVNLDNFLIGVSLGLKHRKLKLSSNFLIAAITALSTFAATKISDILSENLLFFSSLAGAVFLIVFGFFCLIRPEDDERVCEKYQLMTLKQTLLLGLVLSINCIPPAFFAGMLNIPPLLMGLSTGLFSFMSMFISNRFGNFFNQKPWVKKLTPFSYILLIIIGVAELFL